MARDSLREWFDTTAGHVEEGALIIAQDFDPALSIEHYVQVLDGLGHEVARRAAPPNGGPSDLRRELVALRLMLSRHGFSGNRDDYYNPDNSLLDRVIDRGLGIPISLAVVVLAVARRAGIVAEGIGFPGHFLVRLGGEEGVMVDPFDALRVLDRPALEDLLRRHARGQVEVKSWQFRPMSTPAMLIRMLGNLRGAFERRGDRPRSLLVLNRLVELDPRPGNLRDRGMLALSLGSRAVATPDLEAYLEASPDAADKREIAKALSKSKVSVLWN